MAYGAGAGESELEERIGPADGGRMRVDTLWRHSERIFDRQRRMLFYWQALAELFYPERADFTCERSPGAERLDDIFDEEPILMRRDMANSLGARMRPRGKDWFALTPADEHLAKSVSTKRWCEGQAKVVRKAIYDNAANFAPAMRDSDNDYVAFGNSVVRHSYSSDETTLLFECLHLRDCAWEIDRDKKVCGMHERRKIPCGEFPTMFPFASLPEAVRLQIEKRPEEERTVRVITIDKGRYQPAIEGQRQGPGKRYCTIYIDEDSRTLLGEGYHAVFPYLVRRWMTVSGEIYARSACTAVALASARTLNGVALFTMEAIEKLVDPTLTAPHDGIVGEMATRAGDVIYYKGEPGDYPGKAPIGTVPTGEPSTAMEYSAERRQFLARAFYVNILKLPTEHEMTAYEADLRADTVLAEAAPVFEPMEAENAILLDGAFARIAAKGGFDEAPDELADRVVRWEFETPLSIAYREQKAIKARKVIESLTLASELDPEARDHVDFDALVRDVVEGVGLASWVRPMEQVAEMRQARAEQAMAEKQAAAAAVAAGVDPKAAGELAVGAGG